MEPVIIAAVVKEVIHSRQHGGYDCAMPELPDITVYVERMHAMLRGHRLQQARALDPFVVRSVTPSLAELEGQAVQATTHLGKRIVISLDDELFVVMHLMIAGRLRWRDQDKVRAPPRSMLALTFDHGTLYLTEARRKRRASVHVVKGAGALAAFDRGGLDVMTAQPETFRNVMRRENHTLKRALTDPRIVSGIGNAYSDEILHAACMSPFRQTRQMSDEELDALLGATKRVLSEWTERLRHAAGEHFPEKVTAFRDAMAVHGRYRQPCPVCSAPVQRIVYASNESNYCARCQTDGRLLADRALSRLLKSNWPKRLEDLEQ